MIVEMDLYLPRPYNVVRKMVDDACAGIGIVPRVVAEIESAGTLTAVIAEGLGATILPESMARRGRRVVAVVAVADRRAGDRGAAGALPVGPPAAVGAGAGGQGHPARARRRSAGQSAQAGDGKRSPNGRHKQRLIGTETNRLGTLDPGSSASSIGWQYSLARQPGEAHGH